MAAPKAEGKPFSLTFHGEGSGADMRVDAAGGGKGRPIQELIKVGRCFRLSPPLTRFFRLKRPVLRQLSAAKLPLMTFGIGHLNSVDTPKRFNALGFTPRASPQPPTTNSNSMSLARVGTQGLVRL
jgi:hypothetical protein